MCARIHTVPDRGCLTTYSPLVRTATHRGQGGHASVFSAAGHLNTSPRLDDSSDTPRLDHKSHTRPQDTTLDDKSDTRPQDTTRHTRPQDTTRLVHYTRPQDTTRLVHTAQQGRPDMYRHTRVLMCINIHMFHNDLYRYTHVSHGHTDV